MSEDQMTLEVLPEDLSKSNQSTGTVETSLSETHIATAVEVAAEASLAADSDANRVEAVSETASEMPNTEAIVNADPATPTLQTLETATETTSESLEVAVSDATVQTESSPESAPAKVPFVAKNKTRRPKPGQPKSVQAKKPRVDAEQGDQAAYKPDEIIQRLQGRSGVYRAYMFEVQTLLAHIKMVGLGPALAVLLAQTDHKSKRRIYWDISKWVFKEQKIKGKNNRSLMESIVYGDSKFLLKATHSVVRFLEDLDQLSRENPPQSTSGSQS